MIRANKHHYNGGNLMVPQIFISSTFYDLKYAREDLGNFIRSYGFEPILFENGDIGYIPGQELDFSCYKTMIASDMAILIVGGRYGSPATGETDKDSFKEYLSVTHKEFDTAVKSNIPVYVFIEANVESEYWLYKKNKEKIENNGIHLDFNAVDNINVFRFIESIRLFPKIPIKTFMEIGEIKSFLRKQWADMFKNYLIERKNENPVHDLEKSIDQMYLTIQTMEIMLQNVGEKIIGRNATELKNVLDKQHIENVAGKIANSFEFVCLYNDLNKIRDYLTFFIDKFFIAKSENLLEYPFSDNLDDINMFYSLFDYENVMITAVKEHLQFDDDISDESYNYKVDIVNRLMQEDYLRKMKFIE